MFRRGFWRKEIFPVANNSVFWNPLKEFWARGPSEGGTVFPEEILFIKKPGAYFALL